jgi:hypothetical protein
VVLRAAFAAAAMFWNELAFLRSAMGDEDFLNEPRLIEMRCAPAAELNRVSETLAHEDTYAPATLSNLFRPDIGEQSRYSDYVHNTRDRFFELVRVMSDMNTSSRPVGLSAPSMVNLSDALRGSEGSEANTGIGLMMLIGLAK